MPAPRKSINELALSGTLSNNRGRYAARIEAETSKATKAATGPLGRVPSHLSKEEKACWRQIVQSVRAGVLGQSDRLMVEVASQLMAKQRRGKAKVAELNRLVSILLHQTMHHL